MFGKPYSPKEMLIAHASTAVSPENPKPYQILAPGADSEMYTLCLDVPVKDTKNSPLDPR